MAQAMIHALQASHRISVVEPNSEARNKLPRSVPAYQHLEGNTPPATMVVIAVKPQDVADSLHAATTLPHKQHGACLYCCRSR